MDTEARLTGKTALVTGGSRGIGRAIALRLAAEGARVVVHYGHAHEAAEATVAAIERRGGRALALQADLTSVEQIRRAFERLDRDLATPDGDPEIDILVNNAGVGTFSSYDETSEAEFDRLVAVNMKGTYFLTLHALPRLRDGGTIVNLSTAATRRPSARATASTMTKAAVETFTVALAADLGARGITVNCLAPGTVATDMNADALRTPEVREAIAGRTALGRIGRPEDVAGVAAFLASDDGAWVTGQCIEVSGGHDLP